MYTNKFFYMQTNIFFSFYVQLYTNNYYYFFKCLLIHFFLYLLPPWRVSLALGLVGLTQGPGMPPSPSPPHLSLWPLRAFTPTFSILAMLLFTYNYIRLSIYILIFFILLISFFFYFFYWPLANPSAGCREVIIYRKSECRTTGIGGIKNTNKIK